MDQEKIGRFISNRRKCKNITQSELAEKLNVTNKSVSNWENGKNMPDISIMPELCNILDISLNELFNGESNESDKGLINYLKEENRKKKIKLIGTIGIIFLVIIISLLFIFFINNYNKINGYILYGNSDNFSYKDNLFIESNITNINSYGIFEIKNKDIKEEDILDISFYSKDRLIASRSGNYKGFKGISYEKNGYDELFPKDVRDNIDNWHIEVIYKYNNEEKKEIIKLYAINILKNNNLFYKKVESISNDIDARGWIEERNIYLSMVKDELLSNRGFKDEIVIDINGKEKTGVLFSKTVGDKQINYHISSGLTEIIGTNKEHFYGNITTSYIRFKTTDGNSYLYNILEDRFIECNAKKCTSASIDTQKIIKEYINCYKEEFEGLLKLDPNQKYGEDEEDS